MQMPLPPSVYQRLTSSPPLMNLAQVLAYHRAYVYGQLVLMGVFLCVPTINVKTCCVNFESAGVTKRCHSRKCKQRRSNKPSRIYAILFAQFFAFNVSSPGAERLLKVIKDVHQFKEMPMTVSYKEEANSRKAVKSALFFWESVDGLYLEISRCEGTQRSCKQRQTVELETKGPENQTAFLNSQEDTSLPQLWSIYAAGNTVPIPFLRATDISPIALLSENMIGGMQQDGNGTVAVEALQELFTSDPQSKKGRRGQNEMPLPPSVYQRLTSSPPLMNLAQVLAYHRACYEEMPLQEMQATQEQQTIQNLCDTLRTILRL
ncbi:hypothetical protein F2Q69_00051155 [Brassica cretica]|uniref:DUF7912 domain-containing protein n=1 Tax=Brassica cretica TaxID=69181 RepID=A0A8S9PJH9_BRACR|nr:hypothetical protein F2Q69_00051155 [Brassica cretica]